jgi:alpha-beta hydrolase superfamily lysophospholipase
MSSNAGSAKNQFAGSKYFRHDQSQLLLTVLSTGQILASQQFPSREILFSPQAFWFGDQQTPMLGWYHPAHRREAGGSRQCGVLLCPPFGHEYMVSYLSYKHLANQLARAGFDVLFFDYNNSGDSADIAGDQVQLWQDNIRCAARQLRELAKTDNLVLLGLRLGALLASSVANDIHANGMVLLAPAISGKAYCREMQVLRKMSALQTSATTDPARQVSEDELTGYEFNAATRGGLSHLDMTKMPEPDMPVLVIARDDMNGSENKLAQHWQSGHMQLSTTPGYAAMMTEDAHQSQLPKDIFCEIVSWLSPLFELSANAEVADLHLPNEAIMRSGAQAVTETLVSFDGMVGVISKPSVESVSSRQLPAVILMNIGANHRVGNHRLYVKLARRLANAGFTVLRFDKSGIGYSRTTPDGKENDVYAASGLGDLHAAMEFLRSAFLHQEFVLGGLCSGAYFSYLAAIDDERVKGVLLMNQLVYHWHEGDSVDVRKKTSIKSTHFYVKAIRNLHTWKRLFKGDIQLHTIFLRLSERVAKRLHIIWQAVVTKLVDSHYFLGKIVRQFHTMQKRGVEIMMIMDAGDSSVDLMTENFGRHGVLLGKSEQVLLEIFHGSDHTFTPMWAQEHVISTITRHLSQRFAAAAAADAEK